MGLADLIKKKVAKGEKIIVDDEQILAKGIQNDERSIGQALEHLHPHISKNKDKYKQWIQGNQPQVGIPKGKKQSMISEHTTVNPWTGLQGTSDMQAMKRKKKVVKRRRPGR